MLNWRQFRAVTARIVPALALVLLMGVSTAWSGAESQSRGFEVWEESPAGITLHYALRDYLLGSVLVDGQKYATITLDDGTPMLVAGAPDLPKTCGSLIIPDASAVTVNIISAEFEEITLQVAPSKGNLLRTVDPASVPYEFGSEYQANDFYPGELARLSDPYILRDHRGVDVRLYPFQYNPVSGLLRVYTDIVLEVVPNGDSELNVPDRQYGAKALSQAFHQIYSHHFLNYTPPLRYAPMDEDGDLLIIAYDAWIANVQPLADHKSAIGIDTTVVGVSTIGNNAISIKNYIQNVYDTSDLAFVLLVGDSVEVATPSASGGSADPTYAKVAGGDDYPDIIVGRFSAQLAAHVDTQVLRTIEYEQNAATTQDWFWRGTGIASNQGPGDDGEYDNVHMDNIRSDLLAYGYTSIDQIYDPSGTASQVTNALNAGRGIVNYCGHGSATSWSTTGFSNTNVNALVNDNELPFIVSVACVNGQFAGQTCFAEAWLRATNGSEPTGAVATYMSSINQSWSPPMEGQDEFNLLLAAETYVTYGALCFGGSCSMMQEYGSDGVNMFNTWHIFGDPSLRVVGTVAPPTGIRVSPGSGLNAAGQSGGPFEPDLIDYTLESMEGFAIDYEVTNSAAWVSIDGASGTLPPYGSTRVTVYINSNANFLGDGAYADEVLFTNLTNGDGNTARAVTLEVGVPTLQYEWNMDTNPGWSIEGQWAWGVPTGGGGQYGNPDPTSGHTGSHVYGYNLSGDYTNSMPEYDLTTSAIDCSELTDVSLRFWRYLGVEQPAYDHAYVRVSNNQTSWMTIWQNDATVTDSSWTYQEFDLSAVADGQPTVYVRWTMGTTDGSWQYCGWNIDDVEIWGLAPSTPVYQPGDLNCDYDVNAYDIDPFICAISDTCDYEAQYPDCSRALADCNGDGDVNAYDIDPFIEMVGNP
ncbi:MAG: C25 family cysteine peptidase [Planctomycetota bacterium]